LSHLSQSLSKPLVVIVGTQMHIAGPPMQIATRNTWSGNYIPSGEHSGNSEHNHLNTQLQNRFRILHFVGPILPRRDHSAAPSDGRFFVADDVKPIVFVMQGTLANYDFGQLINPAIRGLA
jgi:hypothetical protein